MNWTAFASTLLVGFMMSPFLVGHLGDSVYGVWVLVGSLVGYLGLLDFGLTPSIVKFVAEYRARGDQNALNRLVTGSLIVYSLMGLASLVFSFTVAFNFNTLFNSPLDSGTAAAVAILAGINLAIGFPAAVFIGVVRGYQRYDLDATITSLMIFARSAFFVIFTLKGYGIIGLAITTFAFDMVRLAFLVRWAFRLNPNIRIAREHFDTSQLRKLFGYSVFVFMISCAKQMIYFSDSVIIGVFLSTSSVTAFFIAGRLVSYLRLLVEEMVGVLAPTTSDLDARNDHGGISELLIISTKYMLLIALPVSAVFFVMGDTFISLWMGPQYASSAVILTILTVGCLLNLMEMPAYTILLGRGKHRIVAWFTCGQAAANLTLSLLLVKRYGLVGVALGTTIPMVASTLVVLVIYIKYHLNLSLAEYLRRAVPMPLLMQIPFVSALLLLKGYSAPSSLPAFFLEIAVLFVPYGALAFSLCLSRDERRPFLKLAEKFGLKLSPRFS
ncbi:MAG TPA: oligosaccharide flippase family protein [Blastocatellia bacterium]|nr:oligosaccharide flippase family protein [Blastocatellia bacterium]